MKKSITRFASVGAIALLFAAPLSAQNINCSDCIIPSFPNYSPAPSLSIPLAFITTFSSTVTSGGLISPITGGAVSAAVGTQIMALLNGSAGSIASVQDALNTAGDPPTQIAALMLAMKGVSGGGNRTISRGEMRNMTVAFNNMIRASSGAFLSSGNPTLVGIQAVLSNLLAAAGTTK